MFKIKLTDGEFYKNNSGRTQHFKTEEQGKAKIDKLGNIASGAIVVECKARTSTATKENPEVKTSDAKVPKAIKTKKAAPKPEKPEKLASSKTKKNKK